MNEIARSYCLERPSFCGANLTEADLKALRSPLWNGLDQSWEVIESRYEFGDTLGYGSYAEVVKVTPEA